MPLNPTTEKYETLANEMDQMLKERKTLLQTQQTLERELNNHTLQNQSEDTEKQILKQTCTQLEKEVLKWQDKAK